MTRFRPTKSRSNYRSAALLVRNMQNILSLASVLLTILVYLFNTISDPESLAIVLDHPTDEAAARMAALAHKRAQQQLLDILEMDETEPSLFYDMADEPPPPPGPSAQSSRRPLDADEDPLPVERPLELARSMARAVEWSEQRDIQWQGTGEFVETDFGVDSDMPPAPGLGLSFDASPETSGLGLNFGENFATVASGTFIYNDDNTPATSTAPFITGQPIQIDTDTAEQPNRAVDDEFEPWSSHQDVRVFEQRHASPAAAITIVTMDHAAHVDDTLIDTRDEATHHDFETLQFHQDVTRFQSQHTHSPAYIDSPNSHHQDIENVSHSTRRLGRTVDLLDIQNFMSAPL